MSQAPAFNLYNLFHETARRQPDHPAIFGPKPDDALSYCGLDEAIQAASVRLEAAGVQPSDCVGVHVPSGVECVIYNYAVWRCGGCVTPIPVELAPDEKGEICRQIALDYVISTKPGDAFTQQFQRGAVSDLSANARLIPIRSPRQHPDGFGSINAAFIRFTSGTTGASKGVVLSHESIHARIRAANEALRIGPRDRVLWVLSMAYHFTATIVGYLTFGATMVLPANHFAAAIVEAMRRREATVIYASPTHFALLADYPQGAELPGLRLAISTTSALEARVAQGFRQRYSLPISQALGVIEVGLPCINLEPGADRWQGVGRILPAYDLRLDDAGLGPDLKEFLFRGPGFLDAYYHPWRTRDQILQDGWFRTGDVGRVDDDGCLFLCGRSKDVINVMGMKFFPQEVEAVLMSHPHVAAAAVYAQRDERWGEAPHARVVPKNGFAAERLESELRQLCRQRLASYKAPERIEFVSFLPRTASGKVLHRPADPKAASVPPKRPDRQRLNPVDLALRCADRAIRGMGYSGFETQMFVWLSGRVEMAKLRQAILQLARRYPVINARLVEPNGREGTGAYWEFQKHAEAVLEEAELMSDDPEAVLEHAAGLLSTPHDSTTSPPLRFHLLRRPGGRDVLVMQYNHVLIDNNYTVRLLREIDALSQDAGAADSEPHNEPRHLVIQTLRRFSRNQRRQATKEAIELQGRALRGRAAILGKGEEDAPREGKLCIATRQLEPPEAQALQARIVRLCGFPSMSMGILASVFRAIQRHSPQARNADRNYAAGIGLNMGVRGGTAFFQNLLTVVAVSARTEELECRDDLVRTLVRRFRDHLEKKIDLGGLRVNAVFSRRPRHIRWAVEHILRYAFSLWYAYFGSLDAVGNQFCGVPIESVFYAGPAWSPMGISLLVNQHRGRLFFQATYDPQLVPRSLADAFLDEVLTDLRD